MIQSTQPKTNEILVIPNKAVYYQGEEIQGYMIVNLKENLPRASVIVLSLEGKERFQYVPYDSKNNQIHRNKNQFLREREVIAEFPQNFISAGTHTFQFTFRLGPHHKRPPTVSIFQEIKGYGILDLRCNYKICANIYAVDRAEKLMKKSFPIMIKDQIASNRMNFVEIGQSEVFCLFGSFLSQGISTLKVKCSKDLYQKDEHLVITNHIDNTRSKNDVKKVQVKLYRIVRLHSGQTNNQGGGYDIIVK